MAAGTHHKDKAGRDTGVSKAEESAVASLLCDCCAAERLLNTDKTDKPAERLA